MSSTRLVRPIFVVGCPRSGTTLVQCILSASAHAFSLPETHFFSYVLPALNAQPETVLDAAGVQRLREVFQTEAEVLLADAFWTPLQQRAGLTARDVFVEIVEGFRPARELRAIEKTPRHVLHLETIGRAFPDAVFVNVVRDPIDVASSLLGVPFESSRSMLSHAQRWTESVEAARAYGRRHPGRLQSVVYERLVRAPEATVRALCAFIDLPFEAQMLAEFGREAGRNVGRGEAWKQDVSSGVIVDRQGVWRSRMTPGQAWLVAQATRQLRGEYGYLDQSRPGLPPGGMASAGSSGPLGPMRSMGSIRSIAAAIVREARVRFQEARPSTGVVGAARHAGSVLKTLSAS